MPLHESQQVVAWRSMSIVFARLAQVMLGDGTFLKNLTPRNKERAGILLTDMARALRDWESKPPYQTSYPADVAEELERTAKRINEAVEEERAVSNTSPFTKEEIKQDPILQYFAYNHLPYHLQRASRYHAELAKDIIMTSPSSEERTVALRKLLESKDAAVRAYLQKEN